MKDNQFMLLPQIETLVRKYQARWEFCLDGKTHSYYWPGRSARQH